MTLRESLTLSALRKWWTLWCYSFCVLLLQSPHMIEDHCFQVKWATDHLIQTVTIGHWRIPASEVIYSTSWFTASCRPILLSVHTHLFFSPFLLLVSIPSSGKWQGIFNKLAQPLQKIIRKQKTIICFWKDLEALFWSCCPDLNSLLWSQDLAIYKGLWFYFFMHLSRPHFVKCQVDFFIHNPSWCCGWQQGVDLGWRG